MRRPSITFTSLLLAFAVSSGTSAAQEARTLGEGRTLEGSIAEESTDTYRVALGGEQFVYGWVSQGSIDAIVKVTDPDGNELISLDITNRGPEHFSFDSDEAGDYLIEVSADDGGAGDYSITLETVEGIATDPGSRVDQLLKRFDNDETPGAFVGVIEDGELTFTRAYGMANLTYDVPFTTETASNIGSVTKQFTAMAMVLLEQDGLLNLDDDVREHIPEVPDFGDPVTIRNLLNHTGGYREIYNLMGMTGYYQGEEGLDRVRVIQAVERQPERQAAPNTEFNYNNTGYIMMAEIVERLTDMTFPEFVKARIFDPLGMTHSRVKGYQGEVVPHSALGYVPGPESGYRSVRDLAASAGAGGIYTTVEDLARWTLNYRDKTVGGDAGIGALTTNTILASGDSTGYGLGLGLTNRRGQRLWTHTGGDIAHRTYLGWYPDIEAGVLVSSNNGTFTLGVANQIADVFFAEHFEDEAEAEEVVAEGDMPDARKQAIAGDWRIQAGPNSLDIVYRYDEGTVKAQATGQPEFELTPTSDSTLTFIGVQASVTFHFEDDGSVDRATHHQGGDITMTRVEKTDPTPEELAAYTGRYLSEEIETFYEVVVEEGALRLTSIRRPPIDLSHSEDDTFTATDVFNSITFQRDEAGRVVSFTAENARTRDVLFERVEDRSNR